MTAIRFFYFFILVAVGTVLGHISSSQERDGPLPGKLNVHLVAHTHDDPGWLKTVDEYYAGANQTIYQAGVQYILSSVVANLKQDARRKFTYVEMAYFTRWWSEQSEAIRQDVRDLVRSGQLQFSNGAYVMHDEAAAHYVDCIDQTTLGHLFLLEELDVRPKTAWQIDPFGHSNTHASLLAAKVGFDGYFFSRMDFQDFSFREQQRTREFWWQGSRSMPNMTIFSGVLLHDHYNPPDGFYWDGYFDKDQEPLVDDRRLEGYNADKFLALFVETATRNFNVTRGNHIMWTLGNDFNYQNSAQWFANVDRLIKLVNADGRFNAFYSTPNDYAAAKLAEAASGTVQYPTNHADFFPYADHPHAFWTGYFTSRPALKRLIRKASSYITASRQIRAFAGPTAGVQAWNSSLANALGLAQHHDAVTGTSKQHVAFDYALRLTAGLVEDAVATSAAIASMAGFSGVNASSFGVCLLSNISVCDRTRSWTGASPLPVLLWNSVARRRNATVRIPVGITVAEAVVMPVSSGTCRVWGVETIPAPHPVTQYERSPAPGALPLEVVVVLEMPQVGLCSISLVGNSTEREVEKAKRVHVRSAGTTTWMENEHLRVVFGDIAQGEWIRAIVDKASNTVVPVHHDWCAYRSNIGDASSTQASGAYIFRPVSGSTCGNVTQASAVRLVVPGGGVIAVFERDVTFSPIGASSTWITERLSLSGVQRSVTHEFTVGPLPLDPWGQTGVEVVTRLTTNISSQGTLFTDSNGREMQRRQRNVRPNFPFVQTEPIAGNYYPITTAAHINDTVAQLAILVDSSVGGASLVDGQIELMVHRRIMRDDGRGVSEPLNETEFITPYVNCGNTWPPCGTHYGPGLIIRGSHEWVISPSGVAAARTTRELMDEKYGEAQTFIGQPGTSASSNTPAATLAAELPKNLQLTTLQQLNASAVLVRVAHQFDIDEDPSDLSLPATFSFEQMFFGSALNPKRVVEVSLTANRILSSFAPAVIHTIGPMDVRTFVIFTQ